MQTLLVELPFKRAETPSLGLSLLRDVARARGHQVTISYANLDFAKRIGHQTYQRILDAPSELLLGDLVFAAAAFDRSLTAADVDRIKGLARIGNRAVDVDVISDLQHLQQLARQYTLDVAANVTGTAAVYGFSLMFQMTPSLAVAKAIKARDPNAVVVIGGPHCAGSMGRALLRLCPWIDFVCSGDGELAFPDFLDAACATRFIQVPGIVSRRTLAATEAQQVDMDSLPIPDYTDWREQRGAEAGHAFIAPFEASRGCWFGEKSHCIFCGLNGEMIKFRSKSSSRVLAEIERLKCDGATHLEAADQILNPKYLAELFPEISRRDLGVTFFFEVKSTLTRAQLLVMRQAGVVRIQPGIETLSSSILRVLKKGAKSYHNIRLLKWCAELGISASWNFLVNVPGETMADYADLATLLPKLTHLQPPGASVRPMRVDRFSPLWKQSLADGGGSIVPAPAYTLVFGEDSPLLRDIAYHFEFANALPTIAVATGCAEAIEDWCAAVGRASLTWCKPTSEGPAWICDGRGRELRLVELSKAAAYIMETCDAGVSWDGLCRDAPFLETEIQGEMDHLLEAGLIVRVDGVYLSLPVDISEFVRHQPAAITAPMAHTIYCSRMAALSAGSDRIWPREPDAATYSERVREGAIHEHAGR